MIEQEPGFEEKVADELVRLFQHPEELGSRAMKMKEASRVPGASAAEVIVQEVVKLGA